LGIAENVHFLGFRRDIVKLLRAANVAAVAITEDTGKAEIVIYHP
jgi:hypothetical protein